MSARIEQIIEVIEEIITNRSAGNSAIPIPFLRLRAVRAVAARSELNEQTVMTKITRELTPDVNYIHEFDGLLKDYFQANSDKLARLLLKHALDDSDKQLVHKVFASILDQEKTNATLSILFADVCQSTQLFETLGDDEARKIIGNALNLLDKKTTENGGMLIKTIGDEVMCTFPSAESAVGAACDMHRSLGESQEEEDVKISIKIGLQFGDVLVENNDVFGDAVNVAARMVGLAKADQIITTQAVVDNLPIIMKRDTRSLGKLRVRGKQDKVEIYEVIWQEDTSQLTMLPTARMERKTLSLAKLTLQYRGLKIEAGEDRPGINLGRGEQNDVYVDEGLVSRSHARIEFRQSKFVLIDKSTNGTYIQMKNGEKFFVHREEVHLHGEGVISLGQDFGTEAKPVHYKCSF